MDFARPQDIVLRLGLREGMKVGDLGTGSGHYALAASSIVEKTGRVYAVDVQEDVLIRLKDDLSRRGVKNVDTIWGDVEKLGGTGLREHTLDAVILSNILFQLQEKEIALAEIRRVLKSGGKLLLVDWSGAHGGLGPTERQVVPEQDAEELCIRSGFHKEKAFPGGPHHYSILFVAP